MAYIKGEATDADAQGTHFYLITVQYYNTVDHQMASATRSGSWTPRAGQTRSDVFADIMSLVIKETVGMYPEDVHAVTAFDLQSNTF
jgi:hypothetical protein